MIQLSPSYMLKAEEMPTGRERNVKWVDGLRGLASIMVVLTHLARSFTPDAFSTRPNEHASPHFYQLPFVRIIFQGRIGVSIFAFVTGYVCALKPIRLSRQNDQEGAFSSISQSGLRRFPRLFLPAAVATALSWLLAELGVNTIAKRVDPPWLDVLSQDRIGRTKPAIKTLFLEIIGTWTKRENHYDGNQWTMLPLFQESILIYVFLVVTAYLQPRWRMTASFGLVLYYWCAQDPIFGMLGFFGVLVADLQQTPATAIFLETYHLACPIISALLVFLGLSIASYPEENAEWTSWSHALLNILLPILPENSDVKRYATGLGLMLVVLAILISPWLQRLLSTKSLLFLGRMGFAVYLLHMTMIRSVLVIMVYGTKVPVDYQDKRGDWYFDRIEYPGHARMLVCLPLWFPLLYGAAYLWTSVVDPWCERVTNALVEKVKLGAAGARGQHHLPLGPV